MAAAALSRGCPCTDPDKEQFPVVFRDGALPCEYDLPTAGDVGGCCFHTLDRSRSRVT